MKRYILDVNVERIDDMHNAFIKRIRHEVIPTGSYYELGNEKYIEVLYDGWLRQRIMFVPESTVREVKKGIVV